MSDQPGIDPVEISAGRLHLRPWRITDAPAVFAAFTDPVLQRWTPRPVDTIEQAEAWVAYRAGVWGRGGAVAFAVVSSSEGKLLGSVGLSDVAARAVDTVSRWAFDALELHRIELCHSVSNPASCRVAKKAGYRLEGLLRGSFRYADGWHDEHLHSRVADDAVVTEGAG